MKINLFLNQHIQTMLEAATYAPSAINVQPWKFTIVTNKAEMKRLSDISKTRINSNVA